VSGRDPLAWLERAAIGVTPVVALAIVALGLRIGAGGRTRGAMVYARPPGDGRPGLAWQLVVLADEGGVREVLPEATLDVTASTRADHARWHGVTNADGVAEAWLELRGVTRGEPVTLRATAESGDVLVDGVVDWPPSTPRVGADDVRLQATKTRGPLAIEVVLRDGKLVPGAPERAFVRVTDPATGKGVDDVALTFNPEPGLSLDRTTARTSADGWAEVHATAEFLLASWTIDARGAEPQQAISSWYGALPIAPGAAAGVLPQRLPPNEPFSLPLVTPPATRRLYVEVDDASGCDFAQTLDVSALSASGATELVLPPLAPGDYWLVTSSDAHGAESLTGSTLARPFEVRDATAKVTPPDARRAATPFFRFLALDGLARPRALAAGRKKRGMSVVFGALAIAAMLEMLLVLRAAARARIRLARLSEAAREVDGLAPSGGGGVVVLVLVTVLGFALIAALMMVRG